MLYSPNPICFDEFRQVITVLFPKKQWLISQRKHHRFFHNNRHFVPRSFVSPTSSEAVTLKTRSSLYLEQKRRLSSADFMICIIYDDLIHTAHAPQPIYNYRSCALIIDCSFVEAAHEQYGRILGNLLPLFIRNHNNFTELSKDFISACFSGLYIVIWDFLDMGRVKVDTKRASKFGKSRSKKKRGRKPGKKGELPGPGESRREKNCVAQVARVQHLRERRAERIIQGPEGDEVSEPVCVAFTRKLRSLARVGGVHSPEELVDDGAPSYGIVDIQCLNDMLREAPSSCPVCESSDRFFKHSSGNDNGMAMRLYLICKDCNEVLNTGHSSRRIEGGHSQFDVNRRVVFAMRAIGCSFSELNRLSVYMNMPSAMHHSTHIATVKNIETDLEDNIVEILRFYGKAVHKAHAGETDICVSFDGAWQKRFRGSKIGVGFVIDTLTGLVIDFDVLSTHCYGCRFAPSKDDTEEDGSSSYEKWLAEHDPICSNNFDGSPQAMEQQLGIYIWERSEELHKLRYTEYLGDGDTHTCDKLNDLHVYGPDVQILKKDCINHVSKRMGTALREYHQNTPAARLPDKGRFLKDMVPKLQGYYGKAIKNNLKSADEMHDAIWATWYHLSSTDDNPEHNYCPEGEESWCFFQRALAKGEDPPSHDGHDHLPTVVAEGIKPLYERMADKELLERCVRGQTTNPNESLHHLLWNICPKEKFVSLTQVRLACIQAIHMYNEGHIGVARVLSQSLKLPVSPEAGYRMRAIDSNREARSQDSMCAVGRKARSKRKLDASKSDGQKKKWEGTCYGYGLEGKGKGKGGKGKGKGKGKHSK